MPAASLAGKSLMQIFFPIDVVPVIIPVGLAAGLFVTLLGRIGVDPDTSRTGVTEDGAKQVLHAQNYRNTFRQLFADRVKAGHTGIFPNNV